MRAKFINEKFKEESDPIEDLGIGSPPLLKLVHKLNDKYSGLKVTFKDSPDVIRVTWNLTETKKYIIKYFKNRSSLLFPYNIGFIINNKTRVEWSVKTLDDVKNKIIHGDKKNIF
jgi:hypothetical protein